MATAAQNQQRGCKKIVQHTRQRQLAQVDVPHAARTPAHRKTPARTADLSNVMRCIPEVREAHTLAPIHWASGRLTASYQLLMLGERETGLICSETVR